MGVEEFRVGDHAAGFGDVDCGIAQLEAVDERVDEERDFLRGGAEQGLGVGVAGFGGLGDDGENAGKDLVGGVAGAITEFGPTGKFEMAEDFCADGGVGTGAIAFAHGGSYSKTADVEGAALIAEERTVAAGAGGVAVRIATQGGGAGAGDENDGGGLLDGFEREFEIGDEADFCVGECVCDLALHFFVRLRAADSGEACTESFDFTEFDAGFARGGLRGLRERGGCGFMADAERVGGAGASCGAELVVGIEEDAFGFGAAAVEAQDVVHGERIFDFGRLVRSGCEECERR